MQKKLRTARCLLTWMKDNNMPFSKVMTHKAMFYLREKKLGIPFRFDFKQYGPFSPELRGTIESLEDQKEIVVNETSYALTFHFKQYSGHAPGE